VINGKPARKRRKEGDHGRSGKFVPVLRDRKSRGIISNDVNKVASGTKRNDHLTGS
jgi:hypothetical protein